MNSNNRITHMKQGEKQIGKQSIRVKKQWQIQSSMIEKQNSLNIDIGKNIEWNMMNKS